MAKAINYSDDLHRELRSAEVRLLSLKGSDSFIGVVADMFQAGFNSYPHPRVNCPL